MRGFLVVHKWIAAALAAFTISLPASASVIEVTVLGTAGPWNWEPGGLNSGFNYGPIPQDFTAPTTIDLSTLGIAPGDPLFILYRSGLTSAFDPPAPVDQTGYVGSVFKDDAPGTSGQPFPSIYMPSYWGANQTFNGNPLADPENYGVFLQALVGAITDANGNVLFPFPVGPVLAVDDGLGGYTQGFGFGISFAVPANGAFLQLGFNDDIFGDNSGSMQVCVGSASSEVEACRERTVPEPATLLLLGIGFAGIAAARRNRLS